MADVTESDMPGINGGVSAARVATVLPRAMGGRGSSLNCDNVLDMGMDAELETSLPGVGDAS